ncbi:guanine deaminase [Mycoplasma sp. ATU-Cv-703]|uniref:guanine deaminase n=1 Tax=Mycoplasma sp. ATU-Cv-703 TaxID=2498595 RepID=UPI000FDD15FE
MKKGFIVKGHIVYTSKPSQFELIENGHIVVEDDVIKAVGKDIPSQYHSYPVSDYKDKLIIPGLVDTHIHAPQFTNRGLGLDKELLPWLETYTFPEEAKFKDLNYARKVYNDFITTLWKNGVTSSVVFNTIHKDATKLLLDMFKKSGLSSLVGKVNMDINSPDNLVEKTEDSLRDTEEIIKEYHGKHPLVNPIITPRFVPTCSAKLMQGLGDLAKKYQVPVQSHLSENKGEVAWVKELFPDSPDYVSVYERFGLLETPTVMAHCVQSKQPEIEKLKKYGVIVSHCPYSNFNLFSGIAPIRRFFENGVKVGLGSDVSGGHDNSLLHNMVAAIHGSKLLQAHLVEKEKALTTPEAFYLATKGGGEMFGKVGSFEPGYRFDALVIDDRSLGQNKPLDLFERIQRFVYIGDDRNIEKVYVGGKLVPQPNLLEKPVY